MKREESQHQQALIRWADSMWLPSMSLPHLAQWLPSGSAHVGDFLFAVPNGGRRDKITAAILKSEGVRAGVPDLMLALPVGQHPGLFIEMKAQKTGRLSEAQRSWVERLRAAGYRVEVCHGWDAAKAVIEDYLCAKA